MVERPYDPDNPRYLPAQDLWGELLDTSTCLSEEQVRELGVDPIDAAWVEGLEKHGKAWKVLGYWTVEEDSPDRYAESENYTVHVQLGSGNSYLCDYGWSEKKKEWHCWAN